jgi:hypothetical protein
MGMRARQLAETQYSRPQSVEKFRRLLMDVIAEPVGLCASGSHCHGALSALR